MLITSCSLGFENKRFTSIIFRNKCKLLKKIECSTKFTNVMIMCIFKDSSLNLTIILQ